LSFLKELKRRNVLRIGAAYVVGSWLLIQVAETIFPLFGYGDTPARMVVIVLTIAFIPSLIFSWAFEITPEGLKRDADVDRDLSVIQTTGKKLDRIILAVLALALAYFAFDKFVLDPARDAVELATATQEAHQEGRSEALVDSYGDKSIAVLPFVNMSSDPEQEYFSDGISEELLNLLAKIPELRVISRSSSFAFKGEKTDIPTMAKKLNVAHVLEGSVRKAGNQVRITAQLIDARTDTHLWSETYDRELENIFAVQDEISAAIVGTLKVHLDLQVEIAPRVIAATNTEAYDAYLVGRAFINARTPGYQEKAIAAFEEAIRLDENYAPPYAGLSIALELDYNNDNQVAARESAVRAAETAIELNPELAEGHAALGLILLDDAFLLGDTENELKLERAERSLRRAIELDLSLSIAYNLLAIVLQQQGRYEESNAVQERGLLVDPLNPVLSGNMADRLRMLGEHERAEQLLLRLTHLPEPPGLTYSGLARLYFDTGEYDKSLHWGKEVALAYHESRGVLSGMAWHYEHLGLSEDADYWVAVALGRTPQPAERFFSKASQFQLRGDLAGIRAEIDKLRTAPGTDMEGLQRHHADKYAVANIYVENFDVGIDMLESAFDLESLSKVDDLKTLRELESLNFLAYAYQQVGQNDEANELLTQIHEQLNAYVVEHNMDYGPLHHLFAQNFGLRGDFDAAANAMEAAIKAGWLRYLWVMNDPSWAETIADPRITRMLDDVKVELERQRALVEQADAEHDFRAEFAAKRSAPGD